MHYSPDPGALKGFRIIGDDWPRLWIAPPPKTELFPSNRQLTNAGVLSLLTKTAPPLSVAVLSTNFQFTKSVTAPEPWIAPPRDAVLLSKVQLMNEIALAPRRATAPSMPVFPMKLQFKKVAANELIALPLPPDTLSMKTRSTTDGPGDPPPARPKPQALYLRGLARTYHSLR